jgi:FkbM family methyltransferase
MSRTTAVALVNLNRWLARHPRVHSVLVATYNRLVGEKRASRALLGEIRPGDCVWDIGANVGLYTRLFLDRVGPTGRVVAVEPVPSHLEQLLTVGRPDRLTVVPVALGDAEGEVSFVLDGQASRFTDGVADLYVRKTRGERLIADGIPSPDVLKIDVEGAEGHALEGLQSALAGVRVAMIEVHFGIFTRDGRSGEPERIVELLRGHGFKLRWVDPSHLLASR